MTYELRFAIALMSSSPELFIIMCRHSQPHCGCRHGAGIQEKRRYALLQVLRGPPSHKSQLLFQRCLGQALRQIYCQHHTAHFRRSGQ